jgi:light-regulated signal transduction histidine kinase (bacteriophytochrome)
MFPAERTSLKRYSVVLPSSAIAVTLTILIAPIFSGKAPLIVFILATVISAAYGGIGPGLLSTALNTAVIVRFFESRVLILTVDHSGVILFAVLGITVSAIFGRLQRANTDLRRTKERLEIANQKLEERGAALFKANEELQRFAYALAHDLNAPLRGIAALTDVLVNRNAETLDESSKECGGMIVGRVQGMQAMIKGLLDYAAVVEKPEERALVDLNAVVARAVENLDSAIRECNAQIAAGPLPSVRAMESHLVQVFSNLIGNAIKYRPSVRQPQIQVAAVERDEEWVFCVSDNGIGLDMKYADEIFGMFRRLHGEGKYEGSGIGLALCRTVVQRHGGRIWVESEVGKGSRFFFTLPTAAAGARAMKAAAPG